MKKILSLALVLAMVLTMSVTAFAQEITGESGSTDITYTANESYVVTIPDSMSVGTNANVSVKDVVLASGKELTVSVSSTQYNDGWKLKNGDDTIGYTLKIDDTDVANNGTVLTVKSGETATKTLVTAVPENQKPKYSGSYTDKLTFTVTTAADIPDCEATWGTDENQSAFGSLTEAIAAAKDDSSITYIQLQDDLNLSNTIEITGGTFTLDLNGKKITYAERVIAVNGDNAKVTFADSASDGKVISTEDGFGAVGILKGEVVFSGGTYQGSTGLDIRGGTAVTINGGIFTSTADERMLYEGGFAAISAQNIDLCINGGTFNGLYKIMMYDSSVTIKQCDFAGEEVTTVRYVSGKLDLSGYTGKITKLTVYNGVSTDAISDSNVALPKNYGLSTDGVNTVDTLTADTTYSII